MSSPPVYHDVLTPKKDVKEAKEDIPKPPLLNQPARDSPISSEASASATAPAPKKASPKRPAGGINYLDALRALPEIRAIPWMPGKELPPDKSTESPRTQTKSAFLLSTRGKINDPPCNHCTSGVGRFLHCITLEGWFHGACATCQMGTRGNLCSLRSDGGGDKNKQHLTNPSSAELQSPTPQSTNESTPRASSEQSNNVVASNPKRKRESLHNDPPPTDITMARPLLATPTGPPAGPSSYNSPYAIISSAQPNQQHPPYPVHHGNAMPYNHNNPPMINHIYKRPPILNAAPQSAQGENLTWIRPAPITSKATEFRHHRPPISQISGQHLIQPAKGVNRDDSTSLSPSDQLLGTQVPKTQQQHIQLQQQQQHQQQGSFRAQPLQQVQPLQHPHIPANGQGNSPKLETIPSLIELLPKKKQKLVHGLVKNLQEGIRRTQQQTDSMQQQLNQLQAALGMNVRPDVVD